MQLNLKKPICFFDLETTGVSITSDRIVEISILKVFPNGKEEKKHGWSIRKCSFQRNLQPFMVFQMKKLQMPQPLKYWPRRSIPGF
jgi:DNA polymerase III epsilon subunit-like protein